MHPNDGQSRAFELCGPHSLGFHPKAGLRPAAEGGPTESLSGDFAEGLTPGWDAAWIDLGGEG